MAYSPGMLTDRYELTMLDAFVLDGRAGHRAVFEAFSRSLPEGRRYGMIGGLGRLLPMIADFTFDAEEIFYLLIEGIISQETADYLTHFRFTGDIDAYREGDVYFPSSPILTVAGTLGECLVLETLVLSVLNHDTAITSAAARMVTAAAGRPLVEMGSRRTHEEAAVSVARAAYVAGFDSTSNLAAGMVHDIPTVGTAAHAFVLAHASEPEAFASQVSALGAGTTLLVDTYDIAQGIRNAVSAAGPELGAIRIDSGDLATEARAARALLDELGATRTRIIVTSDLDEHTITALADAPVDGYGVGTQVATGSGHPTAHLVYKLVAIADSDSPDAPLRPVTKSSAGKESRGGRKSVVRAHDTAGHLVSESFGPVGAGSGGVQVGVVRGGQVVHAPTVEEIRDHARAALAILPPIAHEAAPGEPYLTATPLATPDEQPAQEPR